MPTMTILLFVAVFLGNVVSLVYTLAVLRRNKRRRAMYIRAVQEAMTPELEAQLDAFAKTLNYKSPAEGDPVKLKGFLLKVKR